MIFTKKFAEDFETKFDSTNYKSNRPLQKGKTNKFISVTKNELGEKIIKTFVWLRAKN